MLSIKRRSKKAIKNNISNRTKYLNSRNLKILIIDIIKKPRDAKTKGISKARPKPQKNPLLPPFLHPNDNSSAATKKLTTVTKRVTANIL